MNPVDPCDTSPADPPPGAAIMRDQRQAPGWNPDRAAIESAAHALINEVIAACTAAIHRHTATGHTDRIPALTEQRYTTAQLRRTITSTEDLTTVLTTLQATADQLRTDTA